MLSPAVALLRTRYCLVDSQPWIPGVGVQVRTLLRANYISANASGDVASYKRHADFTSGRENERESRWQCTRRNSIKADASSRLPWRDKPAANRIGILSKRLPASTHRDLHVENTPTSLRGRSITATDSDGGIFSIGWPRRQTRAITLTFKDPIPWVISSLRFWYRLLSFFSFRTSLQVSFFISTCTWEIQEVLGYFC